MDDKIIEITTEDSPIYKFYPVTSGYVEFQVKAKSDAHVALTTECNDTGHIVEINFGGWDNTRTAITKDRDKTNHAVAETPRIVSAHEFRGFWIRWSKGIINVGRQGDPTEFLSWEDPNPIRIGYVGVATSWGSTGVWKFNGIPEICTPDVGCLCELNYQFKPIVAGFVEFEFRGCRNCNVALVQTPSQNPDSMYEIALGYDDNGKCSIAAKNNEDKVTAVTPDFFDIDEFKKIVIDWDEGLVHVRDQCGTVIVKWSSKAGWFPVKYFGVRTTRGATGDWRISTISTERDMIS